MVGIRSTKCHMVGIRSTETFFTGVSASLMKAGRKVQEKAKNINVEDEAEQVGPLKVKRGSYTRGDDKEGSSAGYSKY